MHVNAAAMPLAHVLSQPPGTAKDMPLFMRALHYIGVVKLREIPRCTMKVEHGPMYPFTATLIRAERSGLRIRDAYSAVTLESRRP